MDKVEVYLILDIVFTHLYEETTNRILSSNVSKPVWIKADLIMNDGKLVYPTFALSALTPFVITSEGKVLKCVYDRTFEGHEFSGYELDLIKGMCVNRTPFTSTEWHTMTDTRKCYHIIQTNYKSVLQFKSVIQRYPKDNTLLKAILEEIELEV
jgi:hypothetical protein